MAKKKLADNQGATLHDREAAPEAIERVPGICGGDACVAGTRIPVWVLERSRQLGISIDDILEDFPSISWKQLLDAWQYAEENRAEIDKQIRENEDE
jgi:uncharacterized protein (DUF433 family)